MREGEPSRTAWGAAIHRAVHPVLDDPVLFDDPLAFPILGADRDEVLAQAPAAEDGRFRVPPILGEAP